MAQKKYYNKSKFKRLKPKKHFFQKIWFWLLFFIIILIALAVYGMFFYPTLQVSHIEISGNQNVATQDIENAAWSKVTSTFFSFKGISIGSRNIFMLNTHAISAEILKTFPQIASARVQPQFPDSISINISERGPVGAWCSNDNVPQCFLIDNTGVAFKLLDSVFDGMIILKDPENKTMTLGQQAVPENVVHAIDAIEDSLNNNFQINIKEVLVSNPLIITTSENWQAYFDPNSDISNQITKMNLLLKDRIPAPSRKTLQYIYLQYQDRAYYK
jgi:cell division septal protein FtsQ